MEEFTHDNDKGNKSTLLCLRFMDSMWTGSKRPTLPLILWISGSPQTRGLGSRWTRPGTRLTTLGSIWGVRSPPLSHTPPLLVSRTDQGPPTYPVPGLRWTLLPSPIPSLRQYSHSSPGDPRPHPQWDVVLEYWLVESKFYVKFWKKEGKRSESELCQCETKRGKGDLWGTWRDPIK